MSRPAPVQRILGRKISGQPCYAIRAQIPKSRPWQQA